MNHIYAECNKINENPLVFKVDSLHIFQSMPEAIEALLPEDMKDRRIILNVDHVDAHVGDVLIANKIYDGESYNTDTLIVREQYPDKDKVIKSLNNVINLKKGQIRYLEKTNRFIPSDIYGTEIHLLEGTTDTDIYDEYLKKHLIPALSHNPYQYFIHLNSYDGGLFTCRYANKALDENMGQHRYFVDVPMDILNEKYSDLNTTLFNGIRGSAMDEKSATAASWQLDFWLNNKEPDVMPDIYSDNDAIFVYGEVMTTDHESLLNFTQTFDKFIDDSNVKKQPHYLMLIKGTNVLHYDLLPMLKARPKVQYKIHDSSVNIEYKYLEIWTE